MELSELDSTGTAGKAGQIWKMIDGKAIWTDPELTTKPPSVRAVDSASMEQQLADLRKLLNDQGTEIFNLREAGKSTKGILEQLSIRVPMSIKGEGIVKGFFAKLDQDLFGKAAK